MAKVRFYKISLELLSKESKENVDFMNAAPDIIEAKDRFNTKLKGQKQLTLLGITPSTINLLLRCEFGEISRQVDIRTINSFVIILQNEYNWKAYASPGTGKLFRASIIKELDLIQLKKLMEDLREEYPELYDISDIRNLFNGTEQDRDSLSFEELEISNIKASPEDIITESAEDALFRINLLPGLEAYKNEISILKKYSEICKCEAEDDKNQLAHTLPYHYIFKGEPGVNQIMPARLMSELLFHLGLSRNRKFARISIPQVASAYAGINFEGYLDEEDTGVVFLEDIFDWDDEEIDENKVIQRLVQKMQQSKGKILFIVSCVEKNKKGHSFNKLTEAFKDNLNYRVIKFGYYSDNELQDIISRNAEIRGYELQKSASNTIAAHISQAKKDKAYDTEYAAGRIIERAFIEKSFKELGTGASDLKKLLSLDKCDFEFLDCTDENPETDKDPFIELEEMIGLGEVKNRIRQITNVVSVRMKKKELGLESKPICLHMAFVGNPGTGKTTVARIIGRIFKRLGFLSSGHFTELTRDNLIGPYIGQTTPKVKKAVKEALGGVMFIDEAYSLYQNSENDYGHEAVAELVKSMEDNKDDMVVIFAGYPKEMEKMINMNPGLRDRIAFKVEFPDFDIDELTKIFIKMCKDSGYSVTSEAAYEAGLLIKQFYGKKKESFGNARIIRKIFERAEVLQNTRICENGTFNKEELTSITLEDIKNLLEDNEIKKMLNEGSKAKIGFQ